VRKATRRISNDVSNKIKREILEVKVLMQLEGVTALSFKVTVTLHVTSCAKASELYSVPSSVTRFRMKVQQF
jgi:hypothetical protein